jgi:cell division septum initiation protein DivIVA
MPALSELLERLRRLRPPPGAAAGVVAVPAAGLDPATEVAFLFAELDELDERCGRMLASARADAAELETAAQAERSRLLAEARAEGERIGAELIARRRDLSAHRAAEIIAAAGSEAVRVRDAGRERIPALVDEVCERLLEGET